MADLKVEVVKITEVNEHENADRLSIATVFGYSVVVGKDQYKSGDCAVYFPVDSILPAELEDLIFAGGKMKLSKHRVRAARIRGCVSQGLLVDIPKIKRFILKDEPVKSQLGNFPVGYDLTSYLKVTKHDPEKNKPAQLKGQQAKKRDTHPLFRKYYQIQHLLKYNRCFEQGETVWETEKLHGTNFRCGWVPTIPRSFIDRLRVKLSSHKWALVRKLGLPAYTFVYGSHNVQLKPHADTYYKDNGETIKITGKTNVYEQCVLANDLMNKIPMNEVWYGEIIGHGIQKGYDYGMEPGSYSVRFFDIMKPTTGRYLPFRMVIDKVNMAELKCVPGYPVDFDMQDITDRLNAVDRVSAIDRETPPEGVVIRSYDEESFLGSGRKVLKLISEAYLLNKNNTENK